MTRVLPLFLFLWAVGCVAVENLHPEPALAWNFQVKKVGESPRGQVFLKVNGVDHLIVQEATTNYQQLKRSEYGDYHIPPKALLASYSWHAGFGDILYVLRKGDRLEVYRQEMDEAEDSRYPVKLVKEIFF